MKFFFDVFFLWFFFCVFFFFVFFLCVFLFFVCCFFSFLFFVRVLFFVSCVFLCVCVCVFFLSVCVFFGCGVCFCVCVCVFVRGHQHVCPLNCHAQLKFEVEKGFHVNNSWTIPFFFSCQSCGIRSVSGAHLRKYANALVPFLLVSVPCFVTNANVISQETFCHLRHVSVAVACSLGLKLALHFKA